MTILSVNETFKNRKPEATVEGRTYSRFFIVQTNDPTDGGYEIFNHAEIPKVGERHNKDTNAVCRIISPTLQSQTDDGVIWFVECKYDTKNQLSDTQDDGETDPCDLPPQISFSYTQYTRVADRAYAADGSDPRDAPSVPVVSSAKQPFDPPLTIEKSNRVITIVRNEEERDYSPDDLDKYNNTVNTKEITIAGIKLATYEGRMRNIPATKKYKTNGDVYYQVTYEIEIDRATHVSSILDAGYYTLNGEDIEKITDSDGDLVTEPRLLNGSGGLLGVTESAFWMEFLIYFEMDWAPLNLPKDETIVRTGGLGGLPGLGGSTGIGGLPGITA